MKRIYTWTCFNFWGMKNIFRKLSAKRGMVMASLQNCGELLLLWLFSEFLQTQKRYPKSLDKGAILNCRLLVLSRQKFSCQLNSPRTHFFRNISYLLLRHKTNAEFLRFRRSFYSNSTLSVVHLIGGNRIACLTIETNRLFRKTLNFVQR